MHTLRRDSAEPTSSRSSSSMTARGTGSVAPLANRARQKLRATPSVLKHATHSLWLRAIEKYCASAVPVSCTRTNISSTSGSIKSAELLPAYISSGTMLTAIVTYSAASSSSPDAVSVKRSPASPVKGSPAPSSSKTPSSSAAEPLLLELKERSPSKTIATRKLASRDETTSTSRSSACTDVSGSAADELGVFELD